MPSSISASRSSRLLLSSPACRRLNHPSFSVSDAVKLEADSDSSTTLGFSSNTSRSGSVLGVGVVGRDELFILDRVFCSGTVGTATGMMNVESMLSLRKGVNASKDKVQHNRLGDDALSSQRPRASTLT